MYCLLEYVDLAVTYISGEDLGLPKGVLNYSG